MSYPNIPGLQGNADFKRYPWAGHTAWGYPFNLLQNVIEHTFAYTHRPKKVSNGTAAAILASTASTTAIQTITTGINQPDVPRVLAATLGGSGLIAGNILITGFNVEGKLITDTIAYSGTGQVTGALVFRYITSVTFPAQSGTSGTLTIDTTNQLGLNHRGVPGKTTIVAIYDTADNNGPYPTSSRPTADAAPSSSNVDNEFIEKNWVIPAHAPDGTTFYYFFYWFHKVLVYPPKDSPEFYSTTTSTSISTSSTSTSSTSQSTSTSISSTSTSVTTVSTSSTSTSTTTLPV
jgi:hypothetical protein